jgi:hypothetical protein
LSTPRTNAARAVARFSNLGRHFSLGGRVKKRHIAIAVGVCSLLVAVIWMVRSRATEPANGATPNLSGARSDDERVGARVTALRIDDPSTHWRDNGFTAMTPPVHLPSDESGRDRIVVWLKLGAGTIGARVVDGEARLVFPAGTIADRVETVGDAVMDVRGTTLDESGERFHVYVPVDEAPSALIGWEWRRSDDGAEHDATDALLARLRTTQRRMHGSAPPTEPELAQTLRQYEKNNNCGACHVHEKPLATTGNVVHRATDENGFFVPLSVLTDESPLERHRPWDVNADDPFLDVMCPSGGKARLAQMNSRRQFACPDFEIPLGRLDFARALAAGDGHAREVCRSRRFLFDHMDQSARAAFAHAFAECSIASTN